MPNDPLLQVLAHQGGWDEILMVAAPLLILAVLLKLANNRAKETALLAESDAE